MLRAVQVFGTNYYPRVGSSGKWRRMLSRGMATDLLDDVDAGVLAEWWEDYLSG